MRCLHTVPVAHPLAVQVGQPTRDAEQHDAPIPYTLDLKPSSSAPARHASTPARARRRAARCGRARTSPGAASPCPRARWRQSSAPCPGRRHPCTAAHTCVCPQRRVHLNMHVHFFIITACQATHLDRHITMCTKVLLHIPWRLGNLASVFFDTQRRSNRLEEEGDTSLTTITCAPASHAIRCASTHYLSCEQAMMQTVARRCTNLYAPARS